MKIVVTVPDNYPKYAVSDYLAEVGRQIEDGMTEGHVDALTHWSTDRS